jgi:hypothetical protein
MPQQHSFRPWTRPTLTEIGFDELIPELRAVLEKTVAPFTPVSLHALLCDGVVLEEKAKAAISPDDPAVAVLASAVNILQQRAVTAGLVCFANELDCVLAALNVHLEPDVPGRRSEQRWVMLDIAHARKTNATSEPTDAEHAAHARALELMEKDYGRGPLLARPIRTWTDFALELAGISHITLNLGELAAFRFIVAVTPKITGEESTEGAVRSELMRERWRKRDREPQWLLPEEYKKMMRWRKSHKR